jgi:hypothetical protein
VSGELSGEGSLASQGPKENVPSGSQTNNGCLRQPAKSRGPKMQVPATRFRHQFLKRGDLYRCHLFPSTRPAAWRIIGIFRL